MAEYRDTGVVLKDGNVTAAVEDLAKDASKHPLYETPAFLRLTVTPKPVLKYDSETRLISVTPNSSTPIQQTHTAMAHGGMIHSMNFDQQMMGLLV